MSVLKIIDIHIGNFGGIKNLKLDFNEGFQIIYGENGYGKSTIMAFIRLMLYGKNSKSRDLNQNLRKKYTPFDGSKMSGSMRCEIGSHIIRIEKEFGKTQANDSIYLLDESSGNVISIPAGMEVGEYLLKIDERTFDKSIFAGSADSDIGNTIGTDEIMAKLANAGTSGNEDISLHAILEDLNENMEKLKSKRGVSGRIPKINEEITHFNQQKSNLLQRKKELEQIKKSDMAMLNKEKTVLRKLIKDMERHEEKADVVTENNGKWILYHIFAIVSFIAGAIIFIYGNKTSIGSLPYGNIGGGILFVVGFFFLLLGRKKPLSHKINNDMTYSEKMSEFMADLGYNGYSLEDLKARESELDWNENDTTEIIQRIDIEIEECKDRINQARRQREELTEEYEAYKLALSVMKDCGAELRSTVSGSLNERAGSIFAELTAHQYDGFMVDENYQIRVRETEEAIYREWKTLSTGTANQAYLSLRIAVNEMVSEQEKMPLILDDILVNYDERRAKQAIHLLQTLNRQVILFTCHPV